MTEKRKVAGAAGGALGLGASTALLTACCVTPIGVMLFGATGAVVLARLSFVQPYAAAGAILMLGVLFWLAYRPAGDGAGNPCDLTARKRLRWIAWGSTGLVAAMLLASFRWLGI